MDSLRDRPRSNVPNEPRAQHDRTECQHQQLPLEVSQLRCEPAFCCLDELVMIAE